MSCDLLQLTVPDARLQGTVRLLFKEGKFNGCVPSNEPIDFDDLASTSGFSIPQEPEIEPRYKFVCGKKEIADLVVKENGLAVQAILHDLTPKNIKRLLRGKDTVALAQAAINAQAIDDFDFATTPSEVGKNYRLTDSSTGTRQPILNASAVIITTGDPATPLVEGTDYVFMKKFGHVRFLTPQTTLLSVEVSADATNITPYELGAAAPIQGWLKVLYYPTVDTVGDQCEPEIMLDSVGFISFEDALEIGEDSAAEPTLKFTVQSNMKVTDLRVLDED